MFPVNLLADFAGGGMNCVTSVLLALLEREKSGRGQVRLCNGASSQSVAAEEDLLAGDRRFDDRSSRLFINISAQHSAARLLVCQQQYSAAPGPSGAQGLLTSAAACFGCLLRLSASAACFGYLLRVLISDCCTAGGVAGGTSWTEVHRFTGAMKRRAEVLWQCKQ